MLELLFGQAGVIILSAGGAVIALIVAYMKGKSSERAKHFERQLKEQERINETIRDVNADTDDRDVVERVHDHRNRNKSGQPPSPI